MRAFLPVVALSTFLISLVLSLFPRSTLLCKWGAASLMLLRRNSISGHKNGAIKFPICANSLLSLQVLNYFLSRIQTLRSPRFSSIIVPSLKGVDVLKFLAWLQSRVVIQPWDNMPRFRAVITFLERIIVTNSCFLKKVVVLSSRHFSFPCKIFYYKNKYEADILTHNPLLHTTL